MADIPDGFEQELRDFCRTFPKVLDEVDGLLTGNAIWCGRTQGLGIMTAEEAINYGLSGPMLRASGVAYDLRKDRPYLDYETYDFDVPIGEHGDVYDRYLVRLEEMRQSLRILHQAVTFLRPGPIWADHPKVVPPLRRKDVLTRMDELIHHFMIIAEGMNPPVGEVYHAIESPKGELGFYIVSDGEKTAYRLRIRSPSFVNLQALESMCVGSMVADVVAIIASLDPVMGEVDR